MVSLPGSLRSLKVCILMTSSVLTMTGSCGLCLSRRWHLRETRSSSTMALQKDLCADRRTQLIGCPFTSDTQTQTYWLLAPEKVEDSRSVMDSWGGGVGVEMETGWNDYAGVRVDAQHGHHN